MRLNIPKQYSSYNRFKLLYDVLIVEFDMFILVRTVMNRQFI